MAEQEAVSYAVLTAVEGQVNTYRVDSHHPNNQQSACNRMMELSRAGTRSFVAPLWGDRGFPRSYKVVA